MAVSMLLYGCEKWTLIKEQKKVETTGQRRSLFRQLQDIYYMIMGQMKK